MVAVRNLIERHVEYTGSPRAQWILETGPTMLPKFVKVFPHEYKRVLGSGANAGRSEGDAREEQ